MTPDPTPSPGPANRCPLVIGYGNSLRQDDGVGWWVARELAVDPRAAGITAIAVHQLTPELAADLHDACRVVFVDARLDDTAPPGQVQVDLVDPGGIDLDAARSSGAGWHHATPASLAALTRALWGPAPPMAIVAVAVTSVGPGETLTPPVATALPAITDLVLRLAHGEITDHGSASKETTDA